MTGYSDGLNYIDLRYQFTPTLKGEYYFGNMEDLYNKHYVGIDHLWKNANFSVNSKFKYFNAKDNGNLFDIDAQNIGLLETLKVKITAWVWVISRLSVSLLTRYQMVSCLKLISLTGIRLVFKQDEKSYHFIYGYDFKDYVPGLNTTLKYVYGDHFKAADGLKIKKVKQTLLSIMPFKSHSSKV